jgi:hypothetical protein
MKRFLVKFVELDVWKLENHLNDIGESYFVRDIFFVDDKEGGMGFVVVKQQYKEKETREKAASAGGAKHRRPRFRFSNPGELVWTILRMKKGIGLTGRWW